MVFLGGGRVKAEDSIDHAVGLSLEATTGDFVRAGESFGTVFARNEAKARSAAKAIADAVKTGDSDEIRPQPLIIERIRGAEMLCH
ncbi:thymidine phosphorylase, partial [Escherichia coli]|nr:thymidine phosphorylase [Escherichia coli]